MKYGVGFGNKT